MKRCPYCAEEIQDAAVKCRFCLSDLPVSKGSPSPQAPAVLPSPEGTAKPSLDLSDLDAPITSRFQPPPRPAQPAGPAPAPAPVPAPTKPASAPRFDTYVVPRSSGVSLMQLVMVACVMAFLGLALYRYFQEAESHRVRASDANLSLYRTYRDTEAPRPQAAAALRTDVQGNPVFKEVAEPSGNREQGQQHYLAGIVYFSKGDYAKAKQEWEASLAADPKNLDAMAGLERLRRLSGEAP